MSLYLGKKKVRVPKVLEIETNKVPKAYLETGGQQFRDMSMASIDGWFDYEDTSNVTYIYRMFYGCTSLTSVPLFDTSKSTNMNGMFFQCYALTSVPLFDTSKVTDMYSMFFQCYALTSVPLFDTSKVTSMYAMFYGCSSLTLIPAFNTSNVTNMGYMLYGCSSLTEIHMTGMKVSFDISASTKFTREALVEILNNLATITSTQTLTMGATNLAKLTNEDKAIATNKGWTLA